MTWHLTWRGHEFSETDLTGAHLAVIVTMLGKDSWDILPSGGPMKLVANLAALLMLADGVSLDVVLAELHAATATELMEALTFTEG